MLSAWAHLLGTRQSSEAASIKAVQPDANQRQMLLGNKIQFAAIVLHSCKIRVMLLEKFLQNLILGRIGDIFQIY